MTSARRLVSIQSEDRDMADGARGRDPEQQTGEASHPAHGNAIDGAHLRRADCGRCDTAVHGRQRERVGLATLPRPHLRHTRCMASRATSLLAFTLACAVAGTGCTTYFANAKDVSGARIALYGSIEVVALPALIALAPIEDEQGVELPYIARAVGWSVILWSADAIIAMIVYCSQPDRCGDD